MTDTHVAGVCGSLADDSATRVSLGVALDAAREAGATADLLDLREFDLPVFDADDREPGDVPELTRRVRAADAVLLEDRLSAIPELFAVTRGTNRRLKQNLGWAFVYNAVAIPMAVSGVLNPLFAAAAMATSSLLVVSNSARAVYKGE